MDANKANILRNIVRVLGCVFAGVAAITAFVFRNIKSIDSVEAVKRISTLCMVARIFAIAMFVSAVVLLVLDLVTKAAPLSVSGIGAGISLIGFVGNFIIAPASTQIGFMAYIAEHANLVTGKFNATQLNMGAYMIVAAGVFLISYNAKCMKSGR